MPALQEHTTHETAILEVVRSLHSRFDSLETYHREQGIELSALRTRLEVLEKVSTHHEDRDATVHEQHRTSIERVERKVDENHRAVGGKFDKMEEAMKEDRKEAQSFRKELSGGVNRLLFFVITTLLGVAGALFYEFVIKNSG